jgi:transcriptional regulator with XRE-family HTH domain
MRRGPGDDISPHIRGPGERACIVECYNASMDWGVRDMNERDAAARRGMILIGRAIYRQRSHLRMTQRDLAIQLGIDQSTISRVENGHRGFRWSRFARLVDELGGLDFVDRDRDPNWWMGGQASPNPYFARLEAERASAAALESAGEPPAADAPLDDPLEDLDSI